MPVPKRRPQEIQRDIQRGHIACAPAASVGSSDASRPGAVPRKGHGSEVAPPGAALAKKQHNPGHGGAALCLTSRAATYSSAGALSPSGWCTSRGTWPV